MYYSDLQKQMINALSDEDAETVVQLFLDYHGLQLLSEGFAEFLADEGLDIKLPEDDDE